MLKKIFEWVDFTDMQEEMCEMWCYYAHEDISQDVLNSYCEECPLNNFHEKCEVYREH